MPNFDKELYDSTPFSDYDGATISNIRRGKGSRKDFIYAQILDKHGQLLVNATLDYCVQVLYERLP